MVTVVIRKKADVIDYGTKELITGICIGIVIGFLLGLFLT